MSLKKFDSRISEITFSVIDNDYNAHRVRFTIQADGFVVGEVFSSTRDVPHRVNGCGKPTAFNAKKLVRDTIDLPF
jgi:hypothetical protein